MNIIYEHIFQMVFVVILSIPVARYLILTFMGMCEENYFNAKPQWPLLLVVSKSY